MALNVDDLEETAEGMLVTLRRSKTDQEGFGRRVRACRDARGSNDGIRQELAAAVSELVPIHFSTAGGVG